MNKHIKKEVGINAVNSYKRASNILSKEDKPISGRPGDPGYEPWTDLARWKHISNPQRGTIQTKNVYRTRYRKRQFPEFESVYFEVIGRPEKNWNTHNYTVGGSGW